jgi:hypothetical protein
MVGKCKNLKIAPSIDKTSQIFWNILKNNLVNITAMYLILFLEAC